MDDFDFEIEILESTEKGSETNLPVNILAIGEVEPGDVRVYIKQNVYRDLEKLASFDTTKELGSVLIGDYSQSDDITHVMISEYIEAKYTEASAATLTFTHDTWEYIHNVHEKKYHEKRIIGWQHTHPSYGVFLSNYDMFIQENFFNLPFQVAYVIDPIQNLRGFFQWKNGKVEKLKGYYLYDDLGKTIKMDQEKTPTTVKHDGAVKSKKLLIAVISFLCAICVFLGISLITLSNNYKKVLTKQENLAAKQNEIIDKQATEEDSLQEFKQSDDDSMVNFIIYTVKPGDNLYSICADNNIDYNSNYRIILSINGILDPNSIYAGQNILLPVT